MERLVFLKKLLWGKKIHGIVPVRCRTFCQKAVTSALKQDFAVG